VTAAATLAENGSPAKLVKVDATEQTAIAESYGVQGYPTIKFFKNGAVSEFNGGRTADEIVAWITKKSGPAAIPCATVEECTKLKADHPICAFGFFDATDTAAYIRFTEAADASEIIFVATTSAEVATEFKAELQDHGAIHVYTDFEEGLFVYESFEWDVNSINAFVGGNSLPLITEFSEEVRWSLLTL
jgi:protein disulfide-isomerase A1